MPDFHFAYFRQAKCKSYPLNRIQFGNYRERREAADSFVEETGELLKPTADRYKLHFSQFLLVLWEIARNAADHASGDALFGMDLYTSESPRMGELVFAFCDFGDGLFESILNFMSRNKILYRNRNKGIAEYYNWALKRGTTTKPRSGVNHGIGMSLIHESAKAIGLSLVVFDAQSLCFLAGVHKISVRELRKNMRDVGRNVGFGYWGYIKIPLRS